MNAPPAPRNVAILIFDDVEVLDFCGPFEVFAVTGRDRAPRPFAVYTVAAAPEPVTARGGLSVNPACAFDDCPRPDVLVVPGGWGTRRVMNDAATVGWVAARAGEAEVVLSVCTGALVLGRAGLLDGREATTHPTQFDLLAQTAPAARVVRGGRRVVDAGKVVTSGGISAGIDAALHVVARLCGRQEAAETARYMEYRWDGAT